MKKKKEFDTSRLAWITYKLMYGKKFDIIEKGRKHVILKLDNNLIMMSGETDFNFGDGWSNTIFKKYSKFLDNVPEKNKIMYQKQLKRCRKLYQSLLNISMIPQTGNLQSTKKGLGNDRIDTYVWALDSYYQGETSLVFNYATYYTTDKLKAYLDSFRENKEKLPIYNYCSKVYGIHEDLVDDLIESGKTPIDSPKRVIAYMNLAYRFWSQKIIHIKMSMNEQKKILVENKRGRILSEKEIKEIENELIWTDEILNNWFNE